MGKKRAINIYQPSSRIAGWWFGTMEFYDFPFRNGNGIIIPTDFQSIIFQRARAKNHQPEGIPYKSPLNPMKPH